MTPLIVILVLVMGASIFLIGAVVFNIPLIPGSPRNNARSSMRTMVASQRNTMVDTRTRGRGKVSVIDTAQESVVHKTADSRLTLRKKLKYARWTMHPVLFRSLEIVISMVAVSLAHLKLNLVMQLLVLVTGPLFMRWLLNRGVEKRFKAFDKDYPQFLMSLVGLLKTGMNPMNAIEASAQGIEDGSLVKSEVNLMMERLRFGVSEDKSIGSFAEDVFHPEIELFVQALLLSRRVGGTLSDTLDRLARQVRRRQYFRNSANAAVGMQRGSIWFIICILAFLEVYLYFVYPEAIQGAINDEFGWQVWQTGIFIILLGIYWVRQVTKIKV